MARKRPSYVSIRARQRNIIEGVGTRDLRYAQAAKEFGVTKSELRKFLETKPKDLRRNFNRSPATRKLYAEGERPETRRILGVKRITRYPFRERVLRDELARPRLANKQQIGKMIQRLYYDNNIAAQEWASYAREHDLPNSMKNIRLLYHNDRISEGQYKTILKNWRNIYAKMTDSYYASWTDELSIEAADMDMDDVA
jgi:hypothetical protein